jgi:hypothetical protein
MDLLRAFALKLLWNMFAVRTGAPPLTLAVAFGLALVVGLFGRFSAYEEHAILQEPDDVRQSMIRRGLEVRLFAPLVAIGLGYAAKWIGGL